MARVFTLQFKPSLIGRYASLYSFADDKLAMAAGGKIRLGDCSRENLREIFNWKTNGRGRSRIERNEDSEIADALRLAVQAKTDRVALAVLRALHGVDVPVASAILTAIDPKRFTVIDFRALAALGIGGASSPSANLYFDYLQACRALAHQHGVTLRNLDRALWQWHKMHFGR